MNQKGLLISFEGLECSGKTSILNELSSGEHVSLLHNNKNPECITLSYPNELNKDSAFTFIDKILKEQLTTIYPKSRNTFDLFRYLLYRKIGIEGNVLNKLNNNLNVLIDRFVMSTLVYQGCIGKQMPIIENLLSGEFKGTLLHSDITFYIDVSSKNIIDRINKRKESGEQLSKNDILTLNNTEKYINAYKEIIDRESKSNMNLLSVNDFNTQLTKPTIVLVDGNRELHEIVNDIIIFLFNINSRYKGEMYCKRYKK